MPEELDVRSYLNRRTTHTGDSQHRASLRIPQQGGHVVIDIGSKTCKDWTMSPSVDSGDLTLEQRATQRWVLAALKDHGRRTEAEVDGLVDAMGPKAAIAVALMCGRYVAHPTIANSFGIQPPVPSIFADSAKS